MDNKLRIGFRLVFNKYWIGGNDYIKNIIISFSLLEKEIRDKIKIILILSGIKTIDKELKKFFNFKVDEIIYEDIVIKKKTLYLKIINKINIIFFKKHNTYENKFYENLKVDFLYPFNNVYKNKNIKYITASWIADFQQKYLSYLFSKEEMEAREKIYGEIIDNTSNLVLSSLSAKRDFRKFYPENKCNVEIFQFKTPINKKWYDFSPKKVQNKFNLPDKYFILCNQFWQHKNHLLVFKALKILLKKSIKPIIVCTGYIHDYRNEKYFNDILQLLNIYGIYQQVFILGIIDKFEQIQLIRRSIAVIQPSLFEGWSTIVEEAKILGKNILLSDIDVHKEQSYEKCVFFNKNSSKSLADVMEIQWKKLTPGHDYKEEKKYYKRYQFEIKETIKRFYFFIDNLVKKNQEGK